MSTPLKSLSIFLSPRLLSPLSPKSPRHLSSPLRNDNTKLQTPQRLGSYVSKKLEFAKLSPNNLPFNETIKVEVSEYTDLISAKRNDVILNTPNKRNIVSNGLESHRDLNILGTGRFGKVVRGIYKGKIVAVKVVKNSVSFGEINGLFLNHINIVKTLDIVEKKCEHFSLVIMEYIANSIQLQSILDDLEIDLSKGKILSYAKQICEGVGYCHENKVLHLDVKPRNILVCDNICKLCDFGNSVRITDAERFHHQGTIPYTAPEILQGVCPTEKCDVYSLGVLFWQLRSRVNPYFEVDNTETVIYRVVRCNWRPESDGQLDEYSKLYQKCWGEKPENRPSILRILQELSEIS